MEFSHVPVMLGECIDNLSIKPGGVYLDGTLGGGGHSAAILQNLGPGGRLIGIDRDPEAIQAACARIDDGRFTPVRGNFHDAADILASLGVSGIDGALLDLGVSSRQLDEASRGFSYHVDAPLDMRMDTSGELTAADIVNEWPEREIARILYEYGEERWAARIAAMICERRERGRVSTTGELVGIIDAAIPRAVRSKDGSHPARRTFQALRIAVNDELEPLKKALEDIATALNPGGRLAVIAFHSLEDRIVKQTFRALSDPCECPRDIPVCVCGKKPVVKLVTRKPLKPSDAELKANPRSRSATMRVCERLRGGNI
ncbi:MAG: 16S rRNA (cytosine(1402)-N(4))-methyltransferase RsmH [Clostridia bacterium]|nr:16S rRNA (cytosine(1402)-N(4))-methyltransferase RsmH [Clostridia bacterium]